MRHHGGGKRPALYFSIVAAAVFIIAALPTAVNKNRQTEIPLGNSEKMRVAFLEQNNLNADGVAVEIKKITIPVTGSGEYEEYLNLQKEQEMTLELFLGRQATRYTYKLRERPGILAELIVCDGRIVACNLLDVMANKILKL